MNSKITELRNLIRTEIRSALKEVETNAAAGDPKIQSLYKQLNNLNIQYLKTQIEELQVKMSAITKNMSTLGNQKDLATQSTQDKKAKEVKTADLQNKITGIKKQIADMTDATTKQANTAAK